MNYNGPLTRSRKITRDLAIRKIVDDFERQACVLPYAYMRPFARYPDGSMMMFECMNIDARRALARSLGIDLTHLDC